MQERGFSKEKDGLVFWHGIGLRDDRPDPGPGGGGTGGDTAPDPPNLEGSSPDPPNGESGIGNGNTPDSAGESGGSGHKNDISNPNPPPMALMQKKPPNPPYPPEEGGDGVALLVRAAFEEVRSGPDKNLALYRAGQTTLEILTNSVLGALGVEWGRMDPDERRSWERVVASVCDEVAL